MRIQQLTAELALRSLQSSLAGLSAVEARRREQEYGPNRVEHIPLGRETKVFGCIARRVGIVKGSRRHFGWASYFRELL